MTDTDESEEKSYKDEKGRFVAGNRYGFKPGVSGNPKGRPKKDAVLKELDKHLGDVPRTILYQIIDQACNGRRHFPKTTALGKAIAHMSLQNFIAITTYLDEQSNGRAKQTTDIEGAVITLSPIADEL